MPAADDVLPAMGYGDEQLQELEETINAADCDVVVTGTPIDLGRLISSRHPIRHVRYELEEVGDADARRRARADPGRAGRARGNPLRLGRGAALAAAPRQYFRRMIRRCSDASFPTSAHAFGDERRHAVHAWAQGVEWFWMAFFMVVWILLIASFGYAAVLVALRPPHPTIRRWPTERSVKKA